MSHTKYFRITVQRSIVFLCTISVFHDFDLLIGTDKKSGNYYWMKADALTNMFMCKAAYPLTNLEQMFGKKIFGQTFLTHGGKCLFGLELPLYLPNTYFKICQWVCSLKHSFQQKNSYWTLIRSTLMCDVNGERLL